MANFDINLAGFCIAGLFIAVWAVAFIYCGLATSSRNGPPTWLRCLPNRQKVPQGHDL
jgi:hypothetical protein